MADYNQPPPWQMTNVPSRSRTSSVSLLDHDDNSSVSSIGFSAQHPADDGSSTRSDISDSLSTSSIQSVSSRGSGRTSEYLLQQIYELRQAQQDMRRESNETLRNAIAAVKAGFNTDMRNMRRTINNLTKETESLNVKIAALTEENDELKSKQTKDKEDTRLAMRALKKATDKSLKDTKADTTSKVGAIYTEMNKLKKDDRRMQIKLTNAIEEAKIMHTEMANLKEENQEFKSKLLSSQKRQEYFLQRIQEASTANEDLSQSPIMSIESNTLQTEDQEMIPENGQVMKQDSRQANKPSDVKAFLKQCKDVENLTIQKKKMQQIKRTAANKKEKMRSDARQMQQLCRKNTKHKGRGAIFQPRSGARRFS